MPSDRHNSTVKSSPSTAMLAAGVHGKLVERPGQRTGHHQAQRGIGIMDRHDPAPRDRHMPRARVGPGNPPKHVPNFDDAANTGL
ncbi:hypothetical protein ACWHLZ_43655 [Streptomyces chartreusis]